MRVMLVSDIFGITPALTELANQFEGSSIVDPYNGKTMDFENEAAAYSYFINTIGLDNYLVHLSEVVKSIETDTALVGFSIGATTIWRLSQNESNQFINQAVCFYGSQIRHFIAVEPGFKTLLVFPQSEPSFDVDELIKRITLKEKVKTTKEEYFHGFINPYSNNYNKEGYSKYVDFLSSITI